MSKKILLASAAALGIAAASLFAAHSRPAAAAAAVNPVSIKQCFIIHKALSSMAGGTQIVFVNRSSKSIKRVTFAVAYRNAAEHFLRKVTDVGDFAPGVVIDHKYPLYSDVTYAGTQPRSCTVIAVWWMDGSSWSL
jgi:hypothetical protein